ncbi:MAG TPA: hypothetical protein VGF92_00525 [Stellaceae bacterium]|jgi:hypothetical protein
MNDGKPVIIAVAVGGLALAANSAAAAIALAASSAPPEAAVFAIIGLTAAFVGLMITIAWAFQAEPQPATQHERVFTPWSEREETGLMFAEAAGRSSRGFARTAAAPAEMLAEPAPMPAPAASDGRVIYIADWLKARGAPVDA